MTGQDCRISGDPADGMRLRSGPLHEEADCFESDAVLPDDNQIRLIELTKCSFSDLHMHFGSHLRRWLMSEVRMSADWSEWVAVVTAAGLAGDETECAAGYCCYCDCYDS